VSANARGFRRVGQGGWSSARLHHAGHVEKLPLLLPLRAPAAKGRHRYAANVIDGVLREGGMAGRLLVRSLIRLALMGALVATAGLCAVDDGPHGYAAVSLAVDPSVTSDVADPSAQVAARPGARIVTGPGGTAASQAAPSRDVRREVHRSSAGVPVRGWPLALRRAWAPLHVDQVSRGMAHGTGSSPGRAPPAQAGF
jgi:hypothetical protein